jgi:hypothetical protein
VEILLRAPRPPPPQISACSQYSGKDFRKGLANFVDRGLRFSLQQMSGRKNHSRRADAALRTSALQKGLLQIVQFSTRRQSFGW